MLKIVRHIDQVVDLGMRKNNKTRSIRFHLKVLKVQEKLHNRSMELLHRNLDSLNYHFLKVLMIYVRFIRSLAYLNKIYMLNLYLHSKEKRLKRKIWRKCILSLVKIKEVPLIVLNLEKMI
jgi:hypothetical protein